MNKREKVINRHNKLKKYIKKGEFKNKKKLYSHYVMETEKYNKENPHNQIQKVNSQTIYNDLKNLGVEQDEDTGVLLLPSQVQINNYKKILGNSLKIANYKISPPIEIINNKQNNDDRNKDSKQNSNDSQIKSLYKIMLFCDDTGIDIINSIIYKCFPNINILGSTLGFKVLEIYFNNINDSNTFLNEINSITTKKRNK